jgi:hypothetical protein
MALVNEDYHLVVTNQKAAFLLNTQYNLQHVQPSNHQEQAFFIQYYTELFLTTMRNENFQQMLFDTALNPSGLHSPYVSDPYPYFSNVTCP